MTQPKTLQKALAEWHALEERAAKLAAEHAAVKAEADQMEIELFERMTEEETGSIRNSRLGVNFVQAETPYAQVQDASELLAWAEANGREELFEPKPRKKLLNEIAKECLDNGETFPPGLSFYVKQYISKRAA